MDMAIQRERRQGSVWTRGLHHAWCLGFLLVISQALETAKGQQMKTPPEARSQMQNGKKFSDEWLDSFAEAQNGCTVGLNAYVWTRAGLGMNMNSLLNAWVYAIAVDDHPDIALVYEADHTFDRLTCHAESDGGEETGWPCLFGPVPNLCIFRTVEEWNQFMVSKGVSPERRQEAKRHSALNFVRLNPQLISEELHKIGVDHAHALSVMVQHLQRYMHPQMQEDIEDLLSGSKQIQSLRAAPYVGIHVRRGDKVDPPNKQMKPEATKVESQVYLDEALHHVIYNSTDLMLSDVKGLWVSSDDPLIKREIQMWGPKFFPNVAPDTVVSVPPVILRRGIRPGHVATHTRDQDYHSFVSLFAELRMLAEADVFVGTFSSNIGRLVFLMREGRGYTRQTAISVDLPAWFPGRQ